jgi:hypothetical protein
MHAIKTVATLNILLFRITAQDFRLEWGRGGGRGWGMDLLPSDHEIILKTNFLSSFLYLPLYMYLLDCTSGLFLHKETLIARTVRNAKGLFTAVLRFHFLSQIIIIYFVVINKFTVGFLKIDYMQ